MTIQEYRDKHGEELRKNMVKPWFANLLTLLKDHHPLTTIKTEKQDNHLLQGAPVHLNQIIGYERCLDTINEAFVVSVKQSTEPESEYADTERIPKS